MSDLPKKSEDRVNVFGIVMVGLVTSVLVWVSIVLLMAYYQNTAGSLEDQRNAANKGREVLDLKAKQTRELDESKYVDPKRGIVSIPIDDARELVLRDANSGAASWVPAIGPHDTATVPAAWGRPPDNPAAGAAGTPLAPTDGTPPPAGTPPAPTDGTQPAPTDGAQPAPTDGTQPAPTNGARPAPTGAPTAPDGAAQPSDPSPVVP